MKMHRRKLLRKWIGVMCAVGLLYVSTLRSDYREDALMVGKGSQVYKEFPKYKDFPNITFYVRTASSPNLLYTFYCMLFRTAVFFWPSRYGNMVIVLDDNDADRKFGLRFQKQIEQHYPEWTLKVHYEQFPKNKLIEFPSMHRNLGYQLQLWNTFFIDKYTNDSIIALMDTDAQFRVPLTKEYLLGKNGTKLWVIGLAPAIDQNRQLMMQWSTSTEKALGVKVVACFMTTFPQMMYRDTVINTRNHILKRFNTIDFGYALRQFFCPGILISPINILMNYAWYFERDRYAWHLNMNNVNEINAGLPEKHRITPQDTIPTIVGMAHVNSKIFSQDLFTPGYCETMRAIGGPIEACQNILHDLDTICQMVVIFPHLRPHWPDSMPTWCKEGNERACCKQAVHKHYQDVAHIPREFHTFNITKVKLVETLAMESGVECPPLVIRDALFKNIYKEYFFQIYV